MTRWILATVIAADLVGGAIFLANTAGEPLDAAAARAIVATTTSTTSTTTTTTTLPPATTTVPPATTTVPPATTTVPPPPPPGPDVAAYRGLGTWLDVYDFSPAYSPNGPPAVTPDQVDAMAAQGVRTLYVQASRDDARSPGDIEAPELLGQFLTRAHARGMRVVAWYLPKFADVEADLRRLLAVRDFRADGQGFDGLAVDIEWRKDVPDTATRNARLVELSRRLREATGGATLGAIVLPPVVTEVINPDYWPSFPWRELVPYYDVWMPMAYWTNRTAESGYRDANRYVDENIRRVRNNVGNAAAAVHPIGGIGDAATVDDYRGFVQAASAQASVGASVYDWRTTAPESWEVLRGAPG